MQALHTLACSRSVINWDSLAKCGNKQVGLQTGQCTQMLMVKLLHIMKGLG